MSLKSNYKRVDVSIPIINETRFAESTPVFSDFQCFTPLIDDLSNQDLETSRCNDGYKKLVNRIACHYPILDNASFTSDDTDLRFKERLMVLINDSLHIPSVTQEKIIAHVVAAARKMVVVVPIRAFNGTPSNMYDIPISGLNGADTKSDHLLAAIQILSGLLCPSRNNSINEGMHWCSMQTIEEDVKNMKIAKDRNSFYAAQKAAAAVTIGFPSLSNPKYVVPPGNTAKRTRLDDLENEEEEDNDEGVEVVTDENIEPPVMNINRADTYERHVWANHGIIFSGSMKTEHMIVSCNVQQIHLIMPRVQIDFEYIFEDQLEDTDTERKWSHDREPEAIIVHFTVFDPRISILRGIGRLIEENGLRKKEAEKTKKKAKKTNAENVDSSGQTPYSPQKFNHFLDIDSWEKWADIVTTVTTSNMYRQHMSIFRTVSNMTQQGSIIDPFVALSPDRLFGEGGEFFYSQLLFSKRWMKKHFSDAEFDRVVKEKWPERKKVVRFTDPTEIVQFQKTYIESIRSGSNSNINLDYENGMTNDDEYIYIYPHCQRVIRMNSVNIGSVRTCSNLLPYRFKAAFCEHSAGVVHFDIPFPVLTAEESIWRRDLTGAVEANLLDPDADGIGIDSRTAADRIWERYFGPINKLLCSSVLMNKEPVGSTRINEIFTDSFASLRKDNWEQPEPLRCVIQWIEEKTLHGQSIFPSFYAPRNEGGLQFRYYENLSAHGNFLANFTETYVEGEPFRAWRFHKSNNLFFLFFALAGRPKFGMQMIAFCYGGSSKGKSRGPSIWTQFSIPGIFTIRATFSTQSLHSHTNQDGLFVLIDDVGQVDNPLFGKDKSKQNGADRTRISEGVAVRTYLATSANGHRNLVELVTGHRYPSWYGSNISWHGMEDFAKTRVFPIYFYTDPCLNKQTNVRIENGADLTEEFSILAQSFQAFSYVLGTLVSSGAIGYHSSAYRVHAEAVLHRVRVGLRKEFPVEKAIEDRENDKFLELLFAVSVQRIWINICSGSYDHPNLRPGMPYSMETFRAIEHWGLLYATEEDTFITLSYFENIAPDACEVACALYLVDQCVKKGFTYSEDPDATFMDGLFPKILDDPNDTTSEARINPNYLLTGISGQYPNSMIKELQARISADYPNCCPLSVNMYLTELLEKFHLHCPIIRQSVPIDGGAIGHIYIRGETQEQFQILKIVTSPTNKKTLLLVVNRGWIESNLKPGAFASAENRRSISNNDFFSSPLENAIMKCGFYGNRVRDVLLPGMTLMCPLDRSLSADGLPTTGMFPMICKTFSPKDVRMRDNNTILMIPSLTSNTTGQMLGYPENDYLPETGFYRKAIRLTAAEAIENLDKIESERYSKPTTLEEIEHEVEAATFKFSSEAVDRTFHNIRKTEGQKELPYPEHSKSFYTDVIRFDPGEELVESAQNDF